MGKPSLVRLLLLGACMILACACGRTPDPAAPAAGAGRGVGLLPAPSHVVEGRKVTIRLPYRSAEGMLWVSADELTEIAPFMFSMLDIEPRGGADGTDVAVYAFEADAAGSARLRFGLVPAGERLSGPVAGRYAAEPAARYVADVEVE